MSHKLHVEHILKDSKMGCNIEEAQGSFRCSLHSKSLTDLNTFVHFQLTSHIT